MSLNPWAGCKGYAKCERTLELNGDQILFKCGHGRYWYLGDRVLPQVQHECPPTTIPIPLCASIRLADFLADEEIAWACDGYIIVGVEGDYFEFIRTHLQGCLAGITVDMDLMEESMRMIGGLQLLARTQSSQYVLHEANWHNNHKQKSSMASNHNFSQSTIHDINRRVHSFDFGTKTNFTTYKLEGIKSLRNVKIKWDFLRAAVKFWDPEEHVFQFNTAKRCLTIEEFFAILGYDPSKKSVAVSCDPRHKKYLFDALDLSTSITGSMIEGHMVNLCAIISRMIDKRTYGVTENMQKKFGLALCFIGKLLLCFGRRGFVDARAISLVNQIKDGDNLVSLILIETLLELYAIFHGGESQNFLGSPLTLQIWLMERLDMIAKPTSSNYGPSSFLSKTVIKTECQTEGDWVKFLNKKSSTLIQWDCYWWKCPSPLLRSLGSDHIFLVRLRRNILLGLEMADRVDQTFIKVHFHKMTTEYFNWLTNKIVDKEAEMVAMRKNFLRDNQERHNENNYEFKRRDKNDEVPNIEEISDQQRRKD
ncbi:hypothetical protein SO802_015161 [Lithocarpus litseifolius]|uniref:DUF7745 domain-containing protein n=1 Tax=Lithocarpus litseifolius TaxID=425828 RepID=A0AAW2CSX8_9ROSI